MTAKEYLNRYRWLNSDIDSRLEQVARFRELATAISPTTGFGSSGDISDKVGKTVAKIIDAENEINKKIDDLVDLKAEIEGKINAIEDERYRRILTERYINLKKWSDVSEAVYIKDLKWLWKLHGRALRKINVAK